MLWYIILYINRKGPILMSSKKTEKKTAKRFTLKQKSIAALICVCIAVIWEFLWLGMPMNIYYVYNSSVGSNIVFLALSVLLTFPENYILHRFLKTDVSVPAMLAVNAVGMVAILYLFAIFRYTAVYLVLIGIFAHISATAFIIGKAPENGKKRNMTAVIVMGSLAALISDMIYYAIYMKMLDDLLMVAGMLY